MNEKEEELEKVESTIRNLQHKEKIIEEALNPLSIKKDQL
jgi:hypothetical protein